MDPDVELSVGQVGHHIVLHLHLSKIHRSPQGALSAHAAAAAAAMAVAEEDQRDACHMSDTLPVAAAAQEVVRSVAAADEMVGSIHVVGLGFGMAAGDALDAVAAIVADTG